MGIKTSVLSNQIMNDFISDFSANSHFIFASSIQNDTVSSNSLNSAKLFLEKTIFGKKIILSNVKYMIKKRFWESDTVYDQYDDTKDLTGLDFFVISEPDSDTGDYSVFKCIDNNSGGLSTDKPQYNSDLSLSNYILHTSDNYRWKYMYSVNSDDYAFYTSKDLFPIINDALVEADAKLGIDLIVVENPDTNNGYESLNYVINSIGGDISGNRRIFINVSPAETFNVTSGYYRNFSFYVTSSNGITSKLYSIMNSGVDVSDQRPYVDIANYNDEITNISSTVWNYSILPNVEIVGNGSGATAIPKLEGSKIKSIQMLTTGNTYTRGIARITQSSIGFNPSTPESGDVSCLLRVIKAPNSIFSSLSGHGSNPNIELNSTHIMLTTELTDVDDIVLPTSNSYAKIGLIRNPQFSTATTIFDNRIKIRVSSVNQLLVGGEITQTNVNGDITFRGLIHTIDSINNFIYLTEFFGPYSDQSEAEQFYLSNMTIDTARPLLSGAGNIDIISNIVEPIDSGVFYSPYIQNTGQVLYITDFEPIERVDNLTEQFKFIIEF